MDANRLGGAIQFAGPAVPAVAFVFSFGQPRLFVQPEDVAGADIYAHPAAVAFLRTHLNLPLNLR